MDDTSRISDSQTLQTLVGGHYRSKVKHNTNEKTAELLIFREEIQRMALNVFTVDDVKHIQFTQNNMSAGADVFPPLLDDKVKLVC